MADEHGVRYYADDSARSAHGRWSVTFDLLPVPLATRWLDIAGPGSTRPAQTRGGNRGGVVDLLVEFGPALHPDARSLELIVRGPASQARVTLPLRWLGSR